MMRIQTATLIGVEVVFRIFGKKNLDLKFQWATNEEVGPSNAGYYDPQTNTIMINVQCQFNQDTKDVLITAIHETLHKQVSIKFENFSEAEYCIKQIKEGAIEFAAQTIGESICSDSIKYRAYGSELDFFNKLGEIVGKNELTIAILSGDFDNVEKIYKQKAKELGISRYVPSFDSLFSITDKIEQGFNETLQIDTFRLVWSPKEAEAVLDSFALDMDNANLLPSAKIDLNFIKNSVSDKEIKVVNSERQARVFCEAIDILKEIVPGNIYYLSPELGVLTYSKLASEKGYTIPTEFGTAWIQSINLQADHQVVGSEGSRTNSIEVTRTHRLRNKENIKKSKTEFEMKLEREKLKLREITDEEFKKIMYLDDLKKHVEEVYPHSPNYYRDLLIRTVDIALQISSSFGFPPTHSDIARKIYQEALNYEKEFLVLGNIWDLAEYCAKRMLQDISKGRFIQKISPKYIKDERPLLEESFANDNYDELSKKKLLEFINVKVRKFTSPEEDKCIILIGQLIQAGVDVLKKFNIFQPTNQEVLVAYILAESLYCYYMLNKEKVDHLVKHKSNDMLDLTKLFFTWIYGENDLGVEKIRIGSEIKWQLDEKRINSETIFINARKFLGDI